MNRSSSKLLIALLLAAGAATACGGDDDDNGDGGGGNGSGTAAELESCKLVCDEMATASCPIAVPADLCQQLCDAFGLTSDACRQAVKTVSDCQLELADICSIQGCDAEEMAYQQACGG